MKKGRGFAATLLCCCSALALFSCAYRGYEIMTEPPVEYTTQRLVFLGEDLPMPVAEVEFTQWIPAPPSETAPPAAASQWPGVTQGATAGPVTAPREPEPGGARYYTGISILPPAIAELRAFLETHPAAELEYDGGGALSAASKQGALNVVNSIRYIAGVPANVVWDDGSSNIAEAAAAIMVATGQVTHTPRKPADWPEASYRLAYQGCQGSNLAGLGTKYDIINRSMRLFLADADASNLKELGHRRWLLNPALGKSAIAAIGAYCAMTVTDNSNTQAGAQHSVVMYPGQVTPVEYFDGGWAWSVSFSAAYSVHGASVTVMRRGDGAAWQFGGGAADGDFSVSTHAYGQPGCVIFRPRGLQIQAGEIYDVQITGVTKNGADWPVRYTVQFL